LFEFVNSFWQETKVKARKINNEAANGPPIFLRSVFKDIQGERVQTRQFLKNGYLIGYGTLAPVKWSESFKCNS
jgi:hypothetical protein